MFIRPIIKMFEDGNVCVCGERGSGKDMLFANVIARRRLEYISNCEYQKKHGLPLKRYPLDFSKIDCGGNTYRDFMEGTVKKYVYPYPQGCDIYITDAGVYLPSQHSNELDKLYKHLPTFFALSRHVAQANVHTNVQQYGRLWNKAREQCRRYIDCISCKVIPVFGTQLVIQRLRVYEIAESCERHVPPLKLPLYVHLSKDRMMAKLYKLNYKILHGEVKERTLIYFNKSAYDTHVFRQILGGDPDEETTST